MRPENIHPGEHVPQDYLPRRLSTSRENEPREHAPPEIKGEQKKMSLFEISILSDLLNQIFPAFSPYFITMICIIKFRLLFDP